MLSKEEVSVGITSEMVLLRLFIFQMGKLRPRRGTGQLTDTQPARGHAGPPGTPGLCLAGASERVETLPGSSQKSKGRRRNSPCCLVTPVKWEAWKISGGGIVKLGE